MRVSLRKNAGFSLVELMVVVAIIGILAAIAVPNFQRFTAKSKQSEAKSALSALYSAERAFQAEWQTYSSSFQVVGYAPVGSYRYDHGFANVVIATAAALPQNYNGPTQGQASAATYCAANPARCTLITRPLDPTGTPGAADPTATTFTSAAQGDIDGDAALDVWTMDERKTLTNTVLDLDL